MHFRKCDARVARLAPCRSFPLYYRPNPHVQVATHAQASSERTRPLERPDHRCPDRRHGHAADGAHRRHLWPAPPLVVEIDGPAEAPLGEQTYFTLISENAVRAEWAIAGFGRDEINPFRQADQIYVEPTDEEQVGESFTLLVTVYDADDNQASARHRFEVAPAPISVEP